MPDKDVPWLLLERYYAGACTPEEQAALDSWLAGDPTRRLLVERLRTVFGVTPPTLDQTDIEREWTKLAAAMNRRPSRSSSIVALLAAGVLALLGVVWLVARHATH
jgi:ferric-dicitrate binding protein FerR (iron transport regulator)